MSVTVTPYFTPTSITGCQLWMDALDSSSITGTTTVTQWNDKSGNARHCSNLAGSNSPSYSATGFNGFPTIVWNNCGMVAPMPAGTFPTSTTIFIAFKSSAPLSGQNGLVSRANMGNSQPAPFDTVSVYASGFTYRLIGNGSGNYNFTNQPDLRFFTTTPSIYMMTVNNTPSWTEYMNGTNQNVNPNLSGAVYSDTATQMQFARNPFNGNISEIIAYSSVLSSNQRIQVEAYLSQKWGLTTSMPGNHDALRTVAYRSSIPTPVKVTGYNSVSYTFAPSQISNCQLWLDSFDPLGTGTAPSYGATFTTLADKSGNARNFSVNTGSTYYCNYESRPSIFISNSIMYASNAVNLTSYTVFIVCQSSNYADNQTAFVAMTGVAGCNDYNSLDSFGFYVDAATNRNRFYGSINQNSVCNSLTSVGANYYPLSQMCYSSTSGGSLLSYVNGNVGGSQNSSITRTGTATGFAIGCDYVNDATKFYSTSPKVFINEIIVYNFVLSDVQRRQVEAYLSQKWALTISLPAGHTGLTVSYYVNQSFVSRAALTAPVPTVKTTGSATGGTVSTANGYRTHSFTTVGSTNFVVTGALKLQVLVVGGGGAGASGYESGGGGAGGAVFNSGLVISAGTYSATVGNGGAGAVILPRGGQGASGTNSSFLTLTGNGGGGGGNYGDMGAGSTLVQTGGQAANGGCGGGGGGNGGGPAGTAGSGNQGYGGGTSTNYGGSGGGGMGSAGSNATTAAGAAGGLGLTYQVGNQSYLVCGGGGGGSELGAAGGSGGSGIGGNGGVGNNTPNGTAPTNGAVNTGSGGGGSYGYTSQSHAGGNGGSGIVIIAYAYP